MTGTYSLPSSVDRRFTLMQQLCDAVISEAGRLGFDICVVAVDTGGHPIVTYRMDLCPYPPLEAARRKAVTACAMRAPTAMVAKLVDMDNVAHQAMSASPDLLAVPGGFPIFLDGMCVGGLGIAGGHYRDDNWLGEAALQAVVGPHAPREDRDD